MNAPPASPEPSASRRNILLLCAGIALTLVGFFCFKEKFGFTKTASTLGWLRDAWNDENKSYEHGWLVAGVMCFFIYKAWPRLREDARAGSNTGLWWVLLGLACWIMGYRAIQPRLAVLAVPALLMGWAHYTMGWRAARHLFFPLSMFIFMIPVPGFDQMTNGLAIISTKLASTFGNLVGIETVASGTQLIERNNAGGELRVDDGCSGIRSFMALMLIAYSYAIVVHKKWSERIFIWVVTLPIAIVANGLRILTILIIAQVHRSFALGAWHNYSGFFSFGAALALLIFVSFLMRQGLRALRPKVKVTRIGNGPSDPPSQP
jgi:exosortase